MTGRWRTQIAVLGFACASALGSLSAATAAEAREGTRVQTLFERANQAYYEGDYRAAARRYRKLLQAGVNDPDVHYNLATAYARAGHYGRAILHYERTLALRAGDEQALHGIEAARRTLARRRAAAEGEASVQRDPSALSAIVRPLSTGGLAWALLAFDVLLFGVLISRRFLTRETPRLATAIVAPLLALLTVAAAAGLAAKTDFMREGQRAIVLEATVPIREGPDPRARRRARAHEGESTRILERHEGFARVRFSDGRTGWMRAAKVEAI